MPLIQSILRSLPPIFPGQQWSKVKQLLRGAKARSLSTLELAVTDALAAVTPHNIRACFRNSGDAL